MEITNILKSEFTVKDQLSKRISYADNSMEITNILKSEFTVKNQLSKRISYADNSMWADWGLDTPENTNRVDITTPSLSVLTDTLPFSTGKTFDLPANILELGNYILDVNTTINNVKITNLTSLTYKVKGDWSNILVGSFHFNVSDGNDTFETALEDGDGIYDSVLDITNFTITESITELGFTPTLIEFITPISLSPTYTLNYALFESISEIINVTPNCDANTITSVDDSTYIATISEGITVTPTGITHNSHIAYYPTQPNNSSSMYNGGANKTITIPNAMDDGTYTIIKQSTVDYTLLTSGTFTIKLVLDIMINRLYTLACTSIIDSLCQCFYNSVLRWEDAMNTNPRYADQYMRKVILELAYMHLYQSALDKGCVTYQDLFASRLSQLLAGCGCSSITTPNTPIPNTTPCNQ